MTGRWRIVTTSTPTKDFVGIVAAQCGDPGTHDYLSGHHFPVGLLRTQLH
ncbi:hypothetical protein [Mycobacterium marseillense]|jgi:hypothetical protein|nr:hypothetical protein [Mycobacterium marseillense]MCV7404318.1 hypothetical protein [Mycobacterium marseillense]MDM3973678.1 hypothetical protein [Mycobacterium marseillense]